VRETQGQLGIDADAAVGGITSAVRTDDLE
jgi:hypothetical protein